jgi:hypothetical protein
MINWQYARLLAKKQMLDIDNEIAVNSSAWEIILWRSMMAIFTKQFRLISRICQNAVIVILIVSDWEIIKSYNLTMNTTTKYYHILSVEILKLKFNYSGKLASCKIRSGRQRDLNWDLHLLAIFLRFRKLIG